MANFDIAFKKTIGHEGRYSNNLNDSGGETMFGITLSKAREYGYDGNMKILPLEKAKEIYRLGFWDKMNLLDIENQDVANEIFDTGVNMGKMISGMFAQMTCNVLNNRAKKWADIIVDGHIGVFSVLAINEAVRQEEESYLKTLNCLQGHRYVLLCLTLSDKERATLERFNELAVKLKPSDKNETFFKGWMKNRVNL